MATFGPFTGTNTAAIPGGGTAANSWPNGALELIASADDGDWVGHSNNVTETQYAGYTLTSIPTDISVVNSLFCSLRYGWSAAQGNSYINALGARVVSSGGGTVLAAADAGGTFTTVVTTPTNTTPTNTTSVGFSYVNTGATTWEGSIIQLEIVRVREKGGDSIEFRVHAGEVGGDYAQSATPVDLDSAISASATVSSALSLLCNVDSSISASATVSSALNLLCNVDSAVAGSATVSAALSVNFVLRSLISASSDSHNVAGHTPTVVADFINEYFRDAAGNQTFDTMFNYTGASLSTLQNETGLTRFNPHNYLVDDSEDLSAVGGWTTQNCSVTSNATSNPDQVASSADRIIEDTASDTHHRISSAGNQLPTGTRLRVYVPVKWYSSGSIRYASIGITSGASDYLNVTFRIHQLSNLGTTSSRQSGGVTLIGSGVLDIGYDDWVLCYIDFSTDSTSNEILIGLADSSDHGAGSRGFDNYTGDGSSGMYAWGIHIINIDQNGVVPNPDRPDNALRNYFPADGTGAVYGARRGAYLYNGSTYDKAGIHIEVNEQTNLQIYSRDFSSWSSNQGVTLSAIAGPSGRSVTGTRVTGNGSGAVPHIIADAQTITADTNYFIAFFVSKNGTHDFVSLNLKSAGTTENFVTCVFNIATGTAATQTDVGTSSGTLTDYGIEDYNEDWYRIWILAQISQTDAVYGIALVPAGYIFDSDGEIANPGISDYIEIAQNDFIQTNAVNISHIPTLGSVTTRAAQSCAVDNANMFSSLGAISTQVTGKVSYRDTSAISQFSWGRWYSDGINNYYHELHTVGSRTGEPRIRIYDSTGGSRTLSGSSFYLSEGINVDFNIASRASPGSAIGIAYGGASTNSSVNIDPHPDLSAVDFQIVAGGFNGFVSLVRTDDEDWNKYGIEEATTETSPNLSDLGVYKNLDSAISAASTVSASLDAQSGLVSAISTSATVSAAIGFNISLDAELGDPDLIVGSDAFHVPATIADFIRERYFTNSTETTFDSMFTYTGASLGTMRDASGNLKYKPHNIIKPRSDHSSLSTAWAFDVSRQFDLTVGQADSEGGTTALLAAAGEATLGDYFFRNQSGNTTTIGEKYTLKFQIKAAGGGAYCRIVITSAFAITINLSTGALTENDSTALIGTPTSVDLGGGWYEITIQFTAQSTTTYYYWILKEGTTGNSFDDITPAIGDGFVLGFNHLYASGLGGMVDNPDRGDSYVINSGTNTPVYLSRRNSYLYNGSSYVNKGITLESEAATNACTESNDFSTTWSISNTDSLTVTSAQDTGPDGQTSMSEIAITDTTNEHHRLQFSVNGSSTYRISAHVKDIDQRYIGLQYRQANTIWAAAVFDMQTGAFTQTSVGSSGTNSVDATYVEDVGNGIYRISAVLTLSGTSATPVAGIATHSTGTPTFNEATGNEIYAGAGTESFLLGHVDIVEDANVPTRHIPTSGATATRAAETLTIAGANMAASESSMSFHHKGIATYSDNNSGEELYIHRWVLTGTDFVSLKLQTISTATGEPAFAIRDTVGGLSSKSASGTTYSPGVNVAMNIAACASTSDTNIAADGTAATALGSGSDPLPDMSATIFQLGWAYNGFFSYFRQDDSYWGDDGIEYITDLNRNVQAVGFFRGYLDSQSGLYSAISAAATVAAELDVVEGGVTYQDLDSAISASATVSAALDAQPGLTSAISATSSVAAALNVQLSLDSNISANGTVSAALSVLWGLDSTIVCVSSVSASLNALRGLDSSLVATSLVSADLDTHTGLSSSISATSSVAADLNALRSLDSTISTTSSVAAALSVTWGLDTAISATSSVAAQISGAINIDSTISATATVSAALDAQTALDSAISATSSVASELNVLRGLDSSISATSSVAAEIGCLVPLDSTIAATSSVAAELNALRSIDSAIATTSSVAAALSVTWGLSSTIAATSSVAAELSGAVNLDSTIAATSSVDAALSVTWGLDTTIAATSSVAAEVSTGLDIDSAISAAATVAAALDAQPGLASAITATSSVAAEIGVYCNIDSAISATSSVAAELDIVAGVTYVDLDSAISCSATVAAALDAQPALTSAISATSTVAAALDAQSGLTSAISATSTVAADLDRQQGLDSAIAASSSVSAELIVDVNLTSTVSAQATFAALLDAQQGFASVITGTSLISSELQNLVGLNTSIDAQSFILGLLEGGTPIDPRGDTVLGETLLGDVQLREKLQGAILLDEEGQGAVILEAV